MSFSFRFPRRRWQLPSGGLSCFFSPSHPVSQLRDRRVLMIKPVKVRNMIFASTTSASTLQVMESLAKWVASVHWLTPTLLVIWTSANVPMNSNEMNGEIIANTSTINLVFPISIVLDLECAKTECVKMQSLDLQLKVLLSSSSDLQLDSFSQSSLFSYYGCVRTGWRNDKQLIWSFLLLTWPLDSYMIQWFLLRKTDISHLIRNDIPSDISSE